MFDSKMLSISRLPQPRLPKNNEELLERAKAKAKALGLYLDGLYLGHHDMSAYLYPYASEDRLIGASLMTTLLYYVDDLFGEDNKVRYSFDLDRFKAAWERGEQPAARDAVEAQLYKAAASYGADFRAAVPEDFLNYYQEYLDAHLAHSLSPAAYTNSEEYLETRLHFGGMYPTLLLIEYCAEEYLSMALREQPDFVAAQKALALIAVISNDLMSYPKEQHSQFNLLNVYLETGEAKTLEQSIQKTIIYLNQLHKDYEHAKANFVAREEAKKPFIKQYISYLDNMLAACYHWQVQTDRYKHPKHILTDLKSI